MHWVTLGRPSGGAALASLSPALVCERLTDARGRPWRSRRSLGLYELVLSPHALGASQSYVASKVVYSIPDVSATVSDVQVQRRIKQKHHHCDDHHNKYTVYQNETKKTETKQFNNQPADEPANQAETDPGTNQGLTTGEPPDNPHDAQNSYNSYPPHHNSAQSHTIQQFSHNLSCHQLQTPRSPQRTTINQLTTSAAKHMFFHELQSLSVKFSNRTGGLPHRELTHHTGEGRHSSNVFQFSCTRFCLVGEKSITDPVLFLCNSPDADMARQHSLKVPQQWKQRWVSNTKCGMQRGAWLCTVTGGMYCCLGSQSTFGSENFARKGRTGSVFVNASAENR